MPRLDNPRHELYAQGIAKGKSQRQSYLDAGYSPTGDPSTDSCASQLLSQLKVIARVSELLEAAAKRTEVTIESISAEYEEARNLAIVEKQTSAAVAATTGKAKLHGLITDKVKSEITGQDGAPLLEGRDLARRIAMTLAMADQGKPSVPSVASDDRPSEGEHVH